LLTNTHLMYSSSGISTPFPPKVCLSIATSSNMHSNQAHLLV
jgi:hypothetical protein